MTTTATVEVQIASDIGDLPDEEQLRNWVTSALQAVDANAGKDFELSVRLVDEDEARELNGRYRNKDKATNVLSFPFEDFDGLPEDMVRPLGDIVVCAPVVAQEASQQKKALLDHWAHMVIHGTLHLLGYDHQNEAQSDTMETLEISILRGFGIENPYRET
jgi:probable rRNA maturation factor